MLGKRQITIALTILVLGAVHAIFPDPEDVAIQDVAADAAALESDALIYNTFYSAKPHGVNCTVTCNGEEMEARDSEEKTCWGTFNVFCHVSKGKMCGFGGFKCEGRWGKYPWGAVCEGEGRNFWVTNTSYHDKPVKLVHAKGCLGVSAITPMAHHNDSNAHSTPTTTNTSAALFEDDDFVSMAADGGGGHGKLETVVEGRCNGGFMKIRKAIFEQSTTELKLNNFEELEALVNETAPLPPMPPVTLFSTQMSFMPVGPPMGPPPRSPKCHDGKMGPQPHGPFRAGKMEPVPHGLHFERPPPPNCTVTCDGKPAWRFGALPCWGVLQVECSGVKTNEPYATNEKDSSSMLAMQDHRRLLQLQPGSQAPSLDAFMLSADAASREEEVKWCFSAKCKGFFSGRWFGSLCGGLTAEIFGVNDMVKLDYCTGKHAVFPLVDKRGPGMGSFCKGKGLFSLQKVVE